VLLFFPSDKSFDVWSCKNIENFEEVTDDSVPVNVDVYYDKKQFTGIMVQMAAQKSTLWYDVAVDLMLKKHYSIQRIMREIPCFPDHSTKRRPKPYMSVRGLYYRRAYMLILTI